MKTSNTLSRILVAAIATVALCALALSATGCSISGAASVPPTQAAATSNAPAATPAAAPAATPAAAATGAATGCPANAAAAPAVAAPAAAVTGPTPAEGKAVVKSSCVGQCHGSGLLNYRAPQTSAQRIASAMGRKAGISAYKQQAVATFFAQ